MTINCYLPTIIATDVEPDDVAAIVLLLQHLQTDKILIIVGEHDNTENKSYLLSSLLTELVPHKFTIIVPGTGTESSFPITQTVKTHHNHKVHCHNAISSIVEFVRGCKGNKCNVVSLKPPRDLLKVEAQQSSTFFNCHLFAYGSYNVRTLLMNTDRDSIENVTYALRYFYNHAFSTVLFFECKNTVFPDSVCKYDDINFAAPLKSLITSWNEHIRKRLHACIEREASECLHYLESLTESNFMQNILPLKSENPRVYRSLEIMHKVVTNADCNMVLADVGLIVCALVHVPLQSVTLSWDLKTFDTMKQPSNGTVWTVQSKNDEEIKKLRKLILGHIRSCSCLIQQ